MYILKSKKERFDNAIVIIKLFLDNYRSDLNFTVEDHTTNNYQKFRNDTLKYNRIEISLEGSNNNTIFGSVHYNTIFRFWHDTIHFKMDLDFSLEQEKYVCYHQITDITVFCDRLGVDPIIRNDINELIYHDIISQGYFYKHNKKFLKDQKSFVYDLFLSDNYKSLVNGDYNASIN